MTFEFRAPDLPGRYRLRWILPMAFKPIRHFYSQEDHGSYDPGNAWWSEKEFVVEAAEPVMVKNVVPATPQQGPREAAVADSQQWDAPLTSLNELVRISLETQKALLKKKFTPEEGKERGADVRANKKPDGSLGK